VCYGVCNTLHKAARYDGLPMETGPLARVLVGAANGQSEIRLGLDKLLRETRHEVQGSNPCRLTTLGLTKTQPIQETRRGFRLGIPPVVEDLRARHRRR
jgi:hypothetical protein